MLRGEMAPATRIGKLPLLTHTLSRGARRGARLLAVRLASGPGVTSSDYGLFRWTKVPRPLDPLDPDMTRPA